MSVDPRAAVLLLLAALALTPARLRAEADDPAVGAAPAAVRAQEAERVALIERLAPAVVAIYGQTREGGGSGVLISPDGLALTNFHVVAPCGETGQAGLSDGRLYPWKLIGFDPGGDLALIRLSGRERFPCAGLGDSAALQPGEWVVAMGNPFALAEDFTPTVTLGIVSGMQRFQEGQGSGSLLTYGLCVQIDTSINPGNSGGPLFDMRGRIVGINGRVSIAERGRVNVGVGYALSTQQIRHFLPDLLAARVPQHGTLHAAFRDRDGGAICESIDLDSPLGKAGLRPGDRIVSFDGVGISSAHQLEGLVTIRPAGWRVEVGWVRQGQHLSATVALGAVAYELPKPPPTPGPRPPATRPAATRPAETRPAATRPAATRPATRPAPRVTRPPRPVLEFKPEDAGKIRDPRINREIGQLLLRQWWAEVARRAPAAGSPQDPDPLDRLLRLPPGPGDPSVFEKLSLTVEGTQRLGGEAVCLVRAEHADHGRRWLWFRLIDARGDFVPHLLAVSPTDQPPADAAPAPRPAEAGPAGTFAAAVDFAARRTVKLYGGGIGVEVGYASGVIISARGDILTAQGVYLADPRLRVVLPDGSTHPARVVRRSDALQCALLSIDAPTPDFFDLAGVQTPDAGDWVIGLANAYNIAQGVEWPSANLGVVSQRARLDVRRRLLDVPYEGDVLVIDAITSNPGSGGGALVTAEGRLAGMIGKVVESRSTGTRLNYAIPVDLLRRWLEGREPAPPPATAPGAAPLDLGIRLFTLGGRRAPAYVDAVQPGSPAAAAGVARDDLILAVNGKAVRDVREAQEALGALAAEGHATLVLKRKNDIVTATIPLNPPPTGLPDGR